MVFAGRLLSPETWLLLLCVVHSVFAFSPGVAPVNRFHRREGVRSSMRGMGELTERGTPRQHSFFRASPTLLGASDGQQQDSTRDGDAGRSGGLDAEEEKRFSTRPGSLQAELDGKKKQEKAFIESLGEDLKMAWREKRREELEAARARMREGFSGEGIPDVELVFDLSFGKSSTDKMCRSLAKQIAYAWGNAQDPSTTCVPRFHLTSFEGGAAEALRRRGAEAWPAYRHVEHFTEVFRERTADLVYLSPDAEEVLEVLRPGTLYVIGGIVDKTVRRGVSRGVARDLDLPCFRLPIQEHVPRESQGRGHVLNVNTVAHILMRFSEMGEWGPAIRMALEAEAPGRFTEKTSPEPQSSGGGLSAEVQGARGGGGEVPTIL
mmetsp:Transcript_39054/g.91855  ORF Transcript_39054/g.91855 Transcript_39054/m.91855 type:complete len:378 (-) Transcript_39054:169-1302(-)